MTTLKFISIFFILLLPLHGDEKPDEEAKSFAAKTFFRQARFITSLELKGDEVVRTVYIKGGKPGEIAQAVVSALRMRMPQRAIDDKSLGGFLIYQLDGDEDSRVRSLSVDRDGSVRAKTFDLRALKSFMEPPLKRRRHVDRVDRVSSIRVNQGLF